MCLHLQTYMYTYIYIYIRIYIYIYIYIWVALLVRRSSRYDWVALLGKRDSIHHHLLEAISETANVLDLRHTSFYAPPPLGGGV